MRRLRPGTGVREFQLEESRIHRNLRSLAAPLREEGHGRDEAAKALLPSGEAQDRGAAWWPPAALGGMIAIPSLEGLPTMLPLPLTNSQVETIMRGAPQLPQDRHKYLQKVEELLYQHGELGDDAMTRACREAHTRSLSRRQPRPVTSAGSASTLSPRGTLARPRPAQPRRRRAGTGGRNDPPSSGSRHGRAGPVLP
jgi:hypothetical protein